VQVLDLTGLSANPTTPKRQWEEPAQPWLEDYMRMNRVSASNGAVLAGILANIAAKCCFVSLLEEDQTAACGLGVLEDQYVGLFDIVTDPDRRGRGLGTALILSILAWAKEQGAQKAYLQVMLENEPALRLYARLGFEEIYKYWYRIKV
jgi:ribosomal protein S18 acetylase RimI-like enzyme